VRSAAIIEALLVGTGGFVGSVLRWACTGWVYRLAPAARIPWGTLAVNVLGCFAIGLLAGLVEERQLLGPRARLFLLAGLLGGFTTFSSFGYETTQLLRDGEHARAATNVLLQVVVGLAAVWAGYALSRVGWA
jgi:CrcB protein